MTGGMRTTSTEKLALITGLLSFDLEVLRRRMIEDYKREQDAIDDDWLKELDETLQEENGKHFEKRLNVRIDLDYTQKWCAALTYVLTGHAPTNQHLNRIGVSEETSCRFCGDELEDIGHFQDGCEGLNFVIPTSVTSEEELRVLYDNSNRLLVALRDAEHRV